MKGKHIIVGVSAGIAAYKAIEVVSRLRKAGAEVKVVMTKNATHIATPMTFGEISGHPVAVDMWEEIHDWNVEHIALATWADAYIVVPATANVIGKIRAGIADDMLTTTIMATSAPKFLCPAMNTEMFNNPIVQRNLEDLGSFGYHIMEPDAGWLACGVTGVGRLPSPENIVAWLTKELQSLDGTGKLSGKTVLVTAGGTQENIDPVRYIGNRSSGKMGYSIAEAALKENARVILVSAPTSLDVPDGVEYVPVDSAEAMQEAVNSYYDTTDIVIMALELVKNPDILKGLGELKTHQLLVGFAAETEHVVDYGMDKVRRKNLDMLVANDVSKSNAGFNVDTNEGFFLYPNKEPKVMPNMQKSELARYIIGEVVELLASK